MATAPATAKKTAAPPEVTVTLTVTYPAKENMTIADFTAEAKKAEAMVLKLKDQGTVTGEVSIGKHGKFKL